MAKNNYPYITKRKILFAASCDDLWLAPYVGYTVEIIHRSPRKYDLILDGTLHSSCPYELTIYFSKPLKDGNTN